MTRRALVIKRIILMLDIGFPSIENAIDHNCLSISILLYGLREGRAWPGSPEP